ncbi:MULTISPECIES: hypothetical protein [Serratia]|nr:MULTISPECIES: hypothetical protein [Serratia]
MGACDQLFQHLARVHPVVATACALLGLTLCVGLGHDEPHCYCVTTRMIY